MSKIVLQNAKQLSPRKKDMNGYAFCWDNVQIGAKTKHYHSESDTKFLLMAMCFAVKDCVAHLHCIEGCACFLMFMSMCMSQCY